MPRVLEVIMPTRPERKARGRTGGNSAFSAAMDNVGVKIVNAVSASIRVTLDVSFSR